MTAKVYFTPEISAPSLVAAYQAVGRKLGGKVAIKLHMGEAGNQNYLDPSLLRELQALVNGSFVDSTTAYGGSRCTVEGHLRTAADHGFGYAPIDILDADGDVKLPVLGGKEFTEALIGAHVDNYDSFISVAHFKGHGMAGFGGAFKNVAVGTASAAGKLDIHGPGFCYHDEKFLQRVTEYAKAVFDKMGDSIVYLNVLNKLSADCDCVAQARPSDLRDIGILASIDPVAIDRAGVDLVNQASEEQGQLHLRKRIEKHHGTYLLEYAESLGLGTQQYELVKL
jgi:uncharacterized Fe-S center protein